MSISENYRSRRRALPLILLMVGLALFLAACQAKATSTPTPTQAAEPADSQTPFPDIKRVSLEEAKAAFDSKSAVFVDVRSAESYNQNHIPGSINIPLADMEKRSGELDPNQWIITACT